MTKPTQPFQPGLTDRITATAREAAALLPKEPSMLDEPVTATEKTKPKTPEEGALLATANWNEIFDLEKLKFEEVFKKHTMPPYDFTYDSRQKTYISYRTHVAFFGWIERSIVSYKLLKNDPWLEKALAIAKETLKIT